MSQNPLNCTRCHKKFAEVGQATNKRTGKPARLCIPCQTQMKAYRDNKIALEAAIPPGETLDSTPWHMLWPASQ